MKKKIIALTLALALAIGLSATALAVDEVHDEQRTSAGIEFTDDTGIIITPPPIGGEYLLGRLVGRNLWFGTHDLTTDNVWVQSRNRNDADQGEFVGLRIFNPTDYGVGGTEGTARLTLNMTGFFINEEIDQTTGLRTGKHVIPGHRLALINNEWGYLDDSHSGITNANEPVALSGTAHQAQGPSTGIAPGVFGDAVTVMNLPANTNFATIWAGNLNWTTGTGVVDSEVDVEANAILLWTAVTAP